MNRPNPGRWLGPSWVSIALLVGVLGCGGTTEQRVGSIYEWKMDPTPENVERIRSLVGDPDRDVRSTAIFALATLGEPDASELALAGLDDTDPFVRSTCAVLLADVEDPRVEAALGERLLGDEDSTVRWRAAESLTAHGGPTALAALADGMSDPSREVRLASVSGIARLAPGEHVAMLARLVGEDPEWEIRVQAARGLGRAGDPGGRGALDGALDDPNEFVRSAAAFALTLLDEARASGDEAAAAE